jgi:pimeloyl-ACP methyl ester carboxylesterase
MYWIVGFLTVYLLALALIAWISLHPPRIPTWLSPGAMFAPQEAIEIQSQGANLVGWWLECEGSKTTVILAHGYMMNKCELTPEAVHLWRRGASCLVFDHRAQGRSSGKKCGFGVDERVDIAAAVKEARRRKPGTKICLVGSSMGSAAIALALADDPTLADAAILDSCYDRFVSASLGWWRFLGGKTLMAILFPTVVLAAPFAGFNPFKVSISKALAKVDRVPILFLHGDKDVLALPEEGQRNFDAYRGPKKIVWFEGCSHSEGRWHYPDRYRETVDSFLEEFGILAIQSTGK